VNQPLPIRPQTCPAEFRLNGVEAACLELLNRIEELERTAAMLRRRIDRLEFAARVERRRRQDAVSQGASG